jgi:hypothetical protein
MKNLTITVSEEVARWARLWAARHNSSVSRVLGELLREMMEREEGYEAAMKQYLERRPRRLKRSGGYPRREAVHDRARLR